MIYNGETQKAGIYGVLTGIELCLRDLDPKFPETLKIKKEIGKIRTSVETIAAVLEAAWGKYRANDQNVYTGFYQDSYVSGVTP